MAARLGTADVLRIDWLLRLRDDPLAIAYSFLRPGSIRPLERAAIRRAKLGMGEQPARSITPDHSEISVSTSQCSPYNAERLGVPPRAPVFRVDVTEFAQGRDSQLEAVEVAPVIYRSDTLSLQMETVTGGGVQRIAARISGVI